MVEEVSERLVDQRYRNRVIESVRWLADGLGQWDANEYFNQFYDLMTFDRRPHPNSVMSEEEVRALSDLCDLINEACDNTPPELKNEELVASGWLARIQPIAERLLFVFLKRGRFDEDFEALQPSYEAGEAWYALVREQP